jgi:hypothetical protein
MNMAGFFTATTLLKHGALHPKVSQEKQNYSGSTATYSPHLSLQHIFSVPKI